jgi:hypothetical protein
LGFTQLRKKASIWLTVSLMLASSIGIQEYGVRLGHHLARLGGGRDRPSAVSLRGHMTHRSEVSAHGELRAADELPASGEFPSHDRVPGLPEEAKNQRSESGSANDADHFFTLSLHSNNDVQSILRESPFLQLVSTADLLHTLRRLRI